MISTEIESSIKYGRRDGKPAGRFMWKAIFLLLHFAIAGLYTHLQAQNCLTKIRNNEIVLKQAVCVNTAGLLQGSTPAGGTGTYRYQWEIARNNCSENSFSPITGATAKDYPIPEKEAAVACYRRIVLSGGCRSESNKIKIEKEDLTGPLPPATKVVQPLCGTNTGTITITNPAPAPGITYSINGAAYTNSTGIFTGLAPKIYPVTVKYPSGCISPVRYDTIQAAPLVNGAISPEAGALCNGNTVKLTVTGGTSYQWYRNGMAINGATAATYTATQPGTYTADILLAGCKGKASNKAVITESEAIRFAVSTTDPTCTAAHGSITINGVKGGSGTGFQYSKDNGVSFQKENTFPALSSGTYQIVVKDGAGCRSLSTTAVIQPAVTGISIAASVVHATCSNASGSVTIQAKGGTAPYQYRLGTGTFETGNVFTALPAGNHTVTVKDAAGCVQETNFTIKQSGSTLSATATVKNPSCGEKGSATIQAAGGEPGYSYSIDGGAFQASALFANLSAGDYKVTVKDGAGCVFQVPFSIKETGNSPQLVITHPPKFCPGGTQNLQDSSIVKGSDQDLRFTYWQDSSATTTIANPTAVPAGKYYIRATNAAGCFATKPVMVTEHTPSPGSITASGPVTLCSGQMLTLTASAGTAYQWYRDGVALPGETAVRTQPTVSGQYSVTIHDGTCLVTASNTITVQFQPCATKPETGVFVPSGFTPNKNGANDVLRPVLYNIASLQYFKVYNRWGQLVFQTNVMGKGWDGTINGAQQPPESYSWLLQCIDNDGKSIRQSGRSLLIR